MAELLSREDFLSLFPNNIIVWGRFKDNKVWKKTNILHNISLTTADSLNTIKDKRDIFFSPNWDFRLEFWEKETKSLTWRSEANVMKNEWNIYCFIADNDLWERLRENIWLTPTVVNKTKRWYHMYFMFKNPVLYKDYKNRRKEVQKKLKELLHADPADIARILRVPWFAYWADNLWEIMIEVEQYNEAERYSFDEWEDKINTLYNNICRDDSERLAIRKKYKWKKMWKAIDDMFNDVQNRVSALDVLEDLYPQFEWREWWEIYEWSRRTHWYKFHRYKNYVNNFSQDDREDRPAWWPRSIAKMKFKSLNQILEYFSDRWHISIDDVRKNVWSTQEIVFEDVSVQWKDNVFKYWNKVEWLIIDEDEKEMRWYNADATDIAFVDALITPIWFTRTVKWLEYIIKITKKWEEPEIRILPSSWTNVELRKFLQKFWLMIPDMNRFFILLYQYIYSVKQEYLFTNKMWLQYIDWKKIIIEKAGTYIDEENWVYVNIEDAGVEEVTFWEWDFDIKDYAKRLVKWYSWEISIPIMLTMILWVNSYFFRERKLMLPQWFVFWLSNSWKTTFLNNLFRSFWIKKEIAAASKAFIYEKYARHYLPTHFSEYRNSWHMQSNIIEWFLRNLADWTVIQKWRADQTVVNYESNASYILDWQVLFTDDASLTRMTIVLANERHKWDLEALENLPNIYKYATTIFKDTEDFNSFVSDSRKKEKQLNKTLDLERWWSRVVTVYSMLFTLLDRLWLWDYVWMLSTAFKQQDWISSQDDIQLVYQKVFNLQYLHSFDVQLYKWWLLINVIAEWLRFISNVDDLKWFVQTVNANFLWSNALPHLTTYVDFDYVYSHKILHWAFLRMLTKTYIDTEWMWKEEAKAFWSLKAFLQEKAPNSELLKWVNFDMNLHKLKSQWKWDITFE